MVFLLHIQIVQFHLYDELKYGLLLLYEYQIYPLNISLTLQSILHASLENQFPMEKPILAALILEILKISIKQNLFCFFYLLKKFFFLPVTLLYLILLACRNFGTLKYQNIF